MSVHSTCSCVASLSTWGLGSVSLFTFPEFPDAKILFCGVLLLVCDYCFFNVCVFEPSGTINVDRCVLVPRRSFFKALNF